MTSPFPRISQWILLPIFRHRSRSLLLRQSLLVGAAILIQVSCILVSCATSLAQSLVVGSATAASLSTDKGGYLTPFADRSAASISSSPDAIRKTLLRQPLYFEPAADGAMTRRSPAGTMRLDAGGKAQFATPGKAAVSLVLDGANLAAKPAGEETLPGRSNYLLGNDPARWRTGVRQFSRVRVPAVYPGIDLVYYGNGSQLEHDYLLAPNADPNLIRMRFQGATTVTDNSTGDLILSQTAGASARNDGLRLLKPMAYQHTADGEKKQIPVSYRPLADGGYGFALGAYDHRQAVVIDPVILYGSYFGGNYNDSIIDLKVANDGSLYLLLTTDSTNLKTTGATTGACVGQCGPSNPDLGNSAQPDMYIAKLDSTAQTLLFATYLGGSGSDQAFNLALDTDGSFYVSGTSHSADFPIVNGYPGGTPVSGGNPAGTLTKLSADGSTILYSTFIGYGLPLPESPSQVGNGAAHAMVTADNGIVYLIGQAGATDGNFIWQKNPLFTVGADFVAKIDTTQTGTNSVVYATRVGDGDSTPSNAQVTSVAVDSKGDVWLYGETKDSAFPATTSGALQPQCTTPASASCLSSFLMELDPTGASVLYATYLGGSGGSNVTSFDLQLDAADTIYVSGYTDQSNFPILNGAYPTLPSSASNYISKISSDGKTLLYSTFVQSDIFSAAVGGKVAFTISSGAGFPLKNNLQTTAPTGNSVDAAFGLLDTTLTGAGSLLVSSYLGTNTGSTQPWRVYLASAGQILIMGETSATDLPVTAAYQATRGGGVNDGFLAIVQPNSTMTLTPSTLTFPSTTVGSTSATMTATLFNGTSKSIYLTQGSLTDSKDFSQSSNCDGILPPQTNCTVTFTFTPQSAGTLTSTYSTGDLDTPSNALTIALSGIGASPAGPQSETLTPANVDFGTVLVGQSATRSATFYNNGPSSVQVNYANSNPAFSVVGSTCIFAVAANTSCTYTLQFSPTTGGPQSGTFQVLDKSSNPTVTLTGTTYISSSQVTLTPNPLNFQNVPEGQGTNLSFTLTNSSGFTLGFPVSQISLVNPSGAFSQNTGQVAGGCDFVDSPTLVLAPGASCLVNIVFNANSPVDTTVSGSITLPFAPPGSSAIYGVTGNFTGNTISDATAVVTPTTIQFPATANGKTSLAQIVNVTNTGEQSLSFVSATFNGTNPTAFAQTNNCTASLGKNGTCQISVTFSPGATGNEFTATLDVKLSTGDVNVALTRGTNPSDFVLTTPAASQSNPNATWTLNIAPLSTSVGFNQPITFTVSGLDASFGTPVFTPSTVTPNAATVTTKLTLGPSPTAQLRRDARSSIPVLTCCMAFLLSFRKSLKSYRSRVAAMMVVLALAVFTLSGCAKDAVIFTVTATSGSTSHQIQLTLHP